MEGKLWLVPTPIGNLDDITLRSLHVLKEADAILCEDTRHSGKLLAHHGISNKLVSYHQHNEHKNVSRLVEELAEGRRYALITDAGTPGISDPGFLLVRAAIEAGISVESLPGPSAILSAVTASGIPCDRFVFLGFPPQKKGRKTFWESLIEEARTMVLYESPHRIQKALAEAAQVFGDDRPACVARELSKLHETYHRGTLAELHAVGEANAYKGEIVLIIQGKN